ncbi:MAG: hypothetical protein ACKV0T_04415 [Planctomycetales bacterium]
MNRTLTWRVLVFLFLSCLSGTRLVAAEFATLLKRIPSEANVLVMVDADRLFASPIAQERGWKKQATTDFAQRPILLPPSAHKLVRAISIDLNSQTTAFEITLLEMPKGHALAKIAERQQGYVEKVSNVETAWLPKGGYVVKLTDELFGVLFPANRQFLSRWLRDRSGQVSHHLLDAARDMKPRGPQVLLAIDLDDVVEKSTLEERAKDLVSLGESQENLDAIVKVFDGIRVAKFAVTFDKTATASLTINFDQSVAPLKEVAKPLILEIMANRGLSLDEADDWDIKLEGRQLTLSGELTDSGLMRLSSLLELPADLIEDPEKDVDADNPVLYATQAHYKTVQTLIDDLYGKKKQSFGQYAQFAEQYAKKIDRLPLLNVDKDMQEYSSRISELLRGGAVNFKGVGIRAGGRQSQVWANGNGTVSYGYNGARYYDNYDYAGQQKRAIRGQERAVGATQAAEMKQAIDEESAAIRKVMVERYKVEF